MMALRDVPTVNRFVGSNRGIKRLVMFSNRVDNINKMHEAGEVGTLNSPCTELVALQVLQEVHRHAHCRRTAAVITSRSAQIRGRPRGRPRCSLGRGMATRAGGCSAYTVVNSFSAFPPPPRRRLHVTPSVSRWFSRGLQPTVRSLQGV